MNSKISPEIVVETARTWLGTPFKYYGRTKKTKYTPGGCDCVGLLIGIASELNYHTHNKPVKFFDKTQYSKIKNHTQLSNNLGKYFKEVNLNNMSAGQIVVLKINKYLEHVGILGEYPSHDSGQQNLTLIHAYIQAGKVVEHSLTEEWRYKIVSVYKFEGLE